MSKTMAALDFSTCKEVYGFPLKFWEPIYVKIGMEFTYSLGFEIVWEVEAMGYQISLDLRLRDISNTVKQAMKNPAKPDVDIVSLRAAGGSAMMKAAIEGPEEGVVNDKRSFYIAITQLTNTSNEAMNEELLTSGDVKDVVISYAKLAKESGLDGVVCSVYEAKVIHEACGSDFLMVTPGIRFADDSKDNQRQVATPAFVKEQGCDYIVVRKGTAKSADLVTTYHEVEKTMRGR